MLSYSSLERLQCLDYPDVGLSEHLSGWANQIASVQGGIGWVPVDGEGLASTCPLLHVVGQSDKFALHMPREERYNGISQSSESQSTSVKSQGGIFSASILLAL